MDGACTRSKMVVGFGDLTHFLAAASAMDDLEVAEALQAHYDPLGAVVAQHGGRVDKCIGDALLFCFLADSSGRQGDQRQAERHHSQRIPHALSPSPGPPEARAGCRNGSAAK